MYRQLTALLDVFVLWLRAQRSVLIPGVCVAEQLGDMNCCVAATLQRLIKKTCTRILKLGLALLDSDRTAAAGLHHTDCLGKQSRRLSWRIGGISKKRT
jgi:hypothetical protein